MNITLYQKYVYISAAIFSSTSWIPVYKLKAVNPNINCESNMYTIKVIP